MCAMCGWLRAASVCASRVRVIRERIGQNLDCHIAIQLCIARAIYLPHAADADLGGNFIRTDTDAGGEGHRGRRGL